MKKQLLFILIVIVALTIAAVYMMTTDITKPTQTNPQNPLPQPEAIVRYNEAVKYLKSATELTIRTKRKTSFVVNGQEYTEVSDVLAFYNALGTDEFQSYVTETLNVGTQTVEIVERFTNKTLYLTVQGCSFTGMPSDDQVLSRYTPYVLLDSSLYKNIFSTKNPATTLLFQSPTAAEAWCLPENGVLGDAFGIVYLNENGHITKSEYTILYTYNNVTVEETVVTEIVGLYTPDLSVLNRPISGVHLTDFDAPRILETMSCYLLESDRIDANYTEYIHCAAFGDVRNREYTLSIADRDSLEARIDAIVTLNNAGQDGKDTTTYQNILFKDGMCSVSNDSNPPQADPAITEDVMRSYYQNLLLGTILLPEHILDAVLTDEGNTYRVVFSVTDDFVLTLCQEVCNALYDDPNILVSVASSYRDNGSLCYIEINKQTGVLCGSGIQYSATFNIGGLDYPLEFTAEQTYSYHSLN